MLNGKCFNMMMNIMYFCVIFSVHAAVVPNLAYQGIPLSVWQDVHSRPNSRLLPDHFETYGYVDRYPPGERANRELVFGIPHRYSDTIRSYERNDNTDFDTYGETFNPYYNSYPVHQPGLNKRTFGYPNLDVLEPIYPENEIGTNLGDVDYNHAEPNPEDVVNFERYLQRYFDHQKSIPSYGEEVEEDSFWPENDMDDTTSIVDNDEEAAVQLHSLVTPRKQQSGLFHLPHPLTKEIQKKSDSLSTSAPIPTTTSTTTTSPIVNSQQGQKEEPLLRPPTTQRHGTPSMELHPQVPESHPQVPESHPQETNTRSIFNTIKRLFKMHNQLQDIPEDRISGAEPRMKRFVSQEDSLLNELHSLNKVKA